jgi:hypothetical protein
MLVAGIKMYIQRSRGGWDHINRFIPATFMCRFQASTLISNVNISWSFLCSVSRDDDEVFVCFIDIGGIVDHHLLNFLFIIKIKLN